MVETKLSYSPNFVVHPGQTLKDELDFLKLTQVKLAQKTGISEKHISQIINGADPITSDTAIKLELALGTPAAFWNNLQKNYELNLARITSEKKIVDQINKAKEFTCYPELVVLGYVEKVNNWKEKTENLLKFFGVNKLSYIKVTEESAFRQTQGKFNEQSLAAWLRCGEIEANKIEVKEFNKSAVKDILPEFKKLTLHPNEFGRKLQELCASIGIAVVYTPHFKNTSIHGSARWLNNKAIIQLNTRGAYSDIFWFTFFHEIGHILLHGVKDKFIDYDGKVKNEEEREADNFATEALIDSVEFEKLLKDRPLSRLKIEAFAKSIGISPGIVAGRLAHKGKVPWKAIAHLRNQLVITI